MTTCTPEQLAQKLSTSRKYRNVCPDTLLRVAIWASSRHSKINEALKAAKRKLHQIYGAYFERIDYSLLERYAAQIENTTESLDIKHLYESILLQHSSTTERLAFLPSLYDDIFSIIGKPKSILDIACGLNPLTIPWMNLVKGASYTGIDIDCRICSIMEKPLAQLGENYRMHCRDVLCEKSGLTADTVFLFKTLPCLEQQEKGISKRLIQSIQADNLVISFPTESLCRKKKGMKANYTRFMDGILSEFNFRVNVLSYINEVFFILN